MRDIFERYGRVTRVFLAKDRETGRAKGFAFISFADRSDAQKACDKVDGCELLLVSSLFLSPVQLMLLTVDDVLMVSKTVGYHHLILRVEFAKRAS